MFGPSTGSFAPLSHRFKVLVYVQCNPILLLMFFSNHPPPPLFSFHRHDACGVKLLHVCTGCKGQIFSIP